MVRSGATPPRLSGGTQEPNRLLAALPARETEWLAPHLECVTLRTGQVLYEPGSPRLHAHFPLDGTVISLVSVLSDGRSAEAAVIGCEGVTGALDGAGPRPASARALLQAGGGMLRIESARLEEAKAACPVLRQLLGAFADALLAQVLQTAACNALHTVDARAGRWLLAIQDRRGTEMLPVTQEILAEMLGVQRTTVTRVLANLAATGAIEPRRGRILITSRARLLAAACECHGAVHRHYEAVAPGLYPPLPRPPRTA